jgi:hypothetical protein
MAENAFAKYVMRGKPGLTPDEKPGVVTAALEGPQGWSGIDPRITWKYVSQPVLMSEDMHSHDFDEFIIFLGGNPADSKDFDAEIEISLGEEGEKHLITASSVVCLSKGLPHGRLNFRKVGKPVVFVIICLAPDYARKPVSVKNAPAAAGTDSKYGKCILKEPTGGPRPLDTEKAGIRISEETTTTAGKLSASFNVHGIVGPHMLPDPPHDHVIDEMLYLIPAGCENWPELGGEVEIGLGEHWEPQKITTAAVLCLPKGVQHCPVYMRKVEKPFYWGHMLPVSTYESSEFDPDAKVASQTAGR